MPISRENIRWRTSAGSWKVRQKSEKEFLKRFALWKFSASFFQFLESPTVWHCLTCKATSLTLQVLGFVWFLVGTGIQLEFSWNDRFSRKSEDPSNLSSANCEIWSNKLANLFHNGRFWSRYRSVGHGVCEIDRLTGFGVARLKLLVIAPNCLAVWWQYANISSCLLNKGEWSVNDSSDGY